MLQLLSQALQTRVSQPQTNAISSQSLGNASPIFSTAQQHSRALTTQLLIDSSISLHPNDDALSTASSVLPNAGVTQTDPLGPVLSQSLPPVPVALRQRILKGEYIDFLAHCCQKSCFRSRLQPLLQMLAAPLANPHELSPSLLGWMPGIFTLP